MSNPEYTMPDVGEGLTEAEIVGWKVAPGDTVSLNQVLVEIETAKSLVESVRRTGRLVYVQEAPGFTSVGSEIAATVTERAFYSLEAPVLRVSGFDTPFPPAKLEGVYLPDADRILEAVDRSLAY